MDFIVVLFLEGSVKFFLICSDREIFVFLNTVMTVDVEDDIKTKVHLMMH